MDKIFKLTNKYIILATPLILFSLISNLYFAFSAQGKLLNLLIALFLILLMTGAFIAGWFNMIKKIVCDPEKENQNTLMSEFSSGVGEFFIPSTCAIVIFLAVTALFLTATYHIGQHSIGNIGISAEAFSKAVETPEALKSFMLSLSNEQIIKMNQWNLLLMTGLVIPNFITIFYFPTLFFKTKNTILELLISIKDLFCKKFFTTLGIGFLIFITYFVLSILMAIFTGNVILHFLITLANFYFITVVGVGIFYYYHTNFISSQLGQNIDVEI